MTERKTTTEGTDPRGRCGCATDNRCPRPATVNTWGDGPPDICEYHDQMWRIVGKGRAGRADEPLEPFGAAYLLGAGRVVVYVGARRPGVPVVLGAGGPDRPRS